MTTPRQTNNSMSAGLFGDSSLDPESSDVDSSSTSATIDSVVPVLPPVSTPVAGPSVSASVAPDPAFLAAVVNAVKVALAAEVKKRLTDLSSKIRTSIQPVFVSRKLNEDLKVREVKPAIVNQQCVVYKFQCNLCDAGYVGYTRGHLHERVDGHKQKSSSICKHYFGDHNSNVPPCLSEQFHVLTKCTNKFDCLIKEMLFIRKLKPSLNVQTDSIRAKVFT